MFIKFHSSCLACVFHFLFIDTELINKQTNMLCYAIMEKITVNNEYLNNNVWTCTLFNWKLKLIRAVNVIITESRENYLLLNKCIMTTTNQYKYWKLHLLLCFVLSSQAIIHPDTGEKIFMPLRMSGINTHSNNNNLNR